MFRGQNLLFGAAVAVSYWFFVQPAKAQITNPLEVAALKAIKNSLIDPMNNLKTWSDGDPCSSNWKGVLCFDYVLPDGYLHVEELQLLKMNFSGTLAPEFGQFSYLKILDVMWNKINGSIPKEIGNITSLKLLLLNGNQLSGQLPPELGYLPNLDRIQIDQNHISGPIPKTFAYLNKTKHFHMNNNSLSGQIPPELSRLPSLVHLLLDNNNLTGYLPPELSSTPKLLILQLDNNNFSGTSIPASYGSMNRLLKMSLRNCSLQGEVPDLSSIPQLGYLDLSHNQLTGNIPSNKLSNNITTIDLSSNFLTGSIPENFSGLPNLQRLSLDNNHLNGSVPTDIWKNMFFTGNRSLLLDFQNNSLTNVSTLNPPANVSILLYGNPVCSEANQLNIEQYCQYELVNQSSGGSGNSKTNCGPCDSDSGFEYNPLSPFPCFCSIPLEVGYRLKSPGFSDFRPYIDSFDIYLSSGLDLAIYQLLIDSFIWEEGPRLKMKLKLFPNDTNKFNNSEVLRIKGMFTGWLIGDSDIFGPYELLNFTLGYYSTVMSNGSGSGLSSGAIVGIVLASVALTVALSTLITILIMRRRLKYQAVSKKRSSSRTPIKVDGVKGFTFEEMALATSNFSSSSQVGQGGYGKVYKGILADGTVVAIKRALEGSLQGSREFCTEIELLSRLHHRNLVSLVGYCDEEDEQEEYQEYKAEYLKHMLLSLVDKYEKKIYPKVIVNKMLVYEFMPNGTLRDHLSAKSKEALSFSMRLSIALGSSRGILYLHTEADPPIFHRDIKASNILLDPKFVAKVADFGLSRLAPVPDIEGDMPGHVSTVVKGTPGYLDPEYFLTHKLTDRSDVYSLGVVFLELLTGRQPIVHGKNIVREVILAHQSGIIFSIIDSRMGSYPSECVEKFVALALRCCQDETDARPSMPEVFRELEIIWRMAPETDTSPLESVVGGLKDGTPTSTSLVDTQLYLSTDISGSNLVSSVIPPIVPR